jgi:lipid-A-disaccharide synthase
MKKTIFISAGEVSGDLHGSYLARKLLELDPELILTGIGSRAMADSGVKILRDIAPYSSVGLVEGIQAVFPVSEVYNLTKKYFSAEPPSLVVLIDNQGFNFRLADLARRYKLPVAYYIGPQEWIWGFKKGPRKVINKVDKIFAVFAREYEIYRDLTDKAEYVGHPLLDILQPVEKSAVRKKLNLSPAATVIGLMPGSRKHEITKLLPVFLQTFALLKKKDPSIEAILITTPIWEDLIKRNFELNGINLVYENSSYYMQACDLILMASGTVTLEAVLLKIPMIANYKLSPLSYLIASMLIRLRYFTLPNIIAERQVIPELIQGEVNPGNLAEKAGQLLDNPELREKMFEDFNSVREALLPEGAILKTAKGILKMLCR